MSSCVFFFFFEKKVDAPGLCINVSSCGEVWRILSSLLQLSTSFRVESYWIGVDWTRNGGNHRRACVIVPPQELILSEDDADDK